MENMILFVVGVIIPTVPVMVWVICNTKKKIILRRIIKNFKENYPSLLNQAEKDKLFFELNLYSTKEEMFMAIDATVAYKKMQLSKEGV